MSGFEGHMAEYRQISIDRFDKTNLKSTVYFLSHCHRDHMVGLSNYSFLNCLKTRSDIFLYCSEVTKLLLLSEPEFKPLSPYIRVLEIGVTTTVTLPDPESEKFQSVAVTALPAGHCPGSVMFLFEGKEGRALYTGDFRWEKNYATTLSALCVNGHMKEMDSMYVDTTFCVPEAFYIPSRDDCLSATASLVVAWLRDSPQRFVHVSSRTKYGHEPLLAHLAKEAETMVHTSREKQRVYDEITELQGVFTTDPTARIHACNWQANRNSESKLPCGYRPPKGSNKDKLTTPEVLVIRPSTMWFTNEPSRLQELVVRPTTGGGLHRVCYSFHSSYSELRDLVSLLRPRRVLPNVLPASDTDWAQVKGRLEKFLTYRHKHHLSLSGDTTAVKPLGLLKRKRQPSVQSESDSDSLVFDSPEKPKRSRRHSSRDDNLPSSQKSAASSIISPAKSDAHSSYKGSDSEEDMFAHSDNDDDETAPPQEGGREVTGVEGSQSLRSYVSGDEEVEEEDQVSSPQFRRFTSRDDIVDETKCSPNVTDNVNSKVGSDDNSAKVTGCGDDDVNFKPVCNDAVSSKVVCQNKATNAAGSRDDGVHSKSGCADTVNSRVETGDNHAKSNIGCGDDKDIENSKAACRDGDGNSEVGCSNTVQSNVDSGHDDATHSKLVCNANDGLKSDIADEVDALKDKENDSEDSETSSTIKLKSAADNCNRETLVDCQVTPSGSGDRPNSIESNKTKEKQSMQDVSGKNKSTSGIHVNNEIGDEKELVMEKSEKDSEKTDRETDHTKNTEKKKETDHETDHTKPAEENDETDHTKIAKKTDERVKNENEKEKTDERVKNEKEKTDERVKNEKEKTDEREKNTENNTETNIISSDSDSDVDCQITKSFIKPRVNPWQRFPPPLTSPRNRFPPSSHSPRSRFSPPSLSLRGRFPPPLRFPQQPCPVHCGHGSQGGVFVADGSIHKPSGHNSPRFKGQRSSSSSIIVRNSQCATNFQGRRKLEGSIDLTDSETESSVDILEKTLPDGDVVSKTSKTRNDQCRLTEEDENSYDLTKDDTEDDTAKERDSHRTEDDADVEDNDDDDLIADETSSTLVAKTRTSPPEAPSRSRHEKDTTDDSNIILVDDIETSENPNSHVSSPVKITNTCVSSNSDSSCNPSGKRSSSQSESSEHIDTHPCCHSSDELAACQDKRSVSSENDASVKPCSEREDPAQESVGNQNPSKDVSGVESAHKDSSSKGCSGFENAAPASRCDVAIDNSTKHDPRIEHPSKSCSKIESQIESQTCDCEGCCGTGQSVNAQNPCSTGKQSAGNLGPNTHTKTDTVACRKHSLSHSGDDASVEPRPRKKQRQGQKDSEERQEKEVEEERQDRVQKESCEKEEREYNDGKEEGKGEKENQPDPKSSDKPSLNEDRKEESTKDKKKGHKEYKLNKNQTKTDKNKSCQNQQSKEKTEGDRQQDKDQSDMEQTEETDQENTRTDKTKNESDTEDCETDTGKSKATKRKSPKKMKVNNMEPDDTSVNDNTNESEKRAKEPEEMKSNEQTLHEENTDKIETEEAKLKKLTPNKDKIDRKETEKSKEEAITLNEEELDKIEIKEEKTKNPTLNKNKMNSKENNENEDDSDATVPPHSPDSTLPPDSPVAVHSSDSDSDADCKITKSFLRSPCRVHQRGCCHGHGTQRSPIRSTFHSPGKQHNTFCPSHGFQRSPVRNSVYNQNQACPSHDVQKSPIRSGVHNSHNQHQTCCPSQRSPLRGSPHSPSSKTGFGPSCSLHPAVPQPHFQPGQSHCRSQSRRGLNPGSVSRGGVEKDSQQSSVIDLTDDD